MLSIVGIGKKAQLQDYFHWGSMEETLAKGNSLPTVIFVHGSLLVLNSLNFFLGPFKKPPSDPWVAHHNTEQLSVSEGDPPAKRLPNWRRDFPHLVLASARAALCKCLSRIGQSIPCEDIISFLLQAACCWLCLSRVQTWFVGVWLHCCKARNGVLKQITYRHVCTWWWRWRRWSRLYRIWHTSHTTWQWMHLCNNTSWVSTSNRDFGTLSGHLQKAVETMLPLPLQLLQAVIGYYCKLCNATECMTPYDVAWLFCFLW